MNEPGNNQILVEEDVLAVSQIHLAQKLQLQIGYASSKVLLAISKYGLVMPDDSDDDEETENSLLCIGMITEHLHRVAIL